MMWELPPETAGTKVSSLDLLLLAPEWTVLKGLLCSFLLLGVSYINTFLNEEAGHNASDTSPS